jgi:transcription elongation factor/antiterminator RfaH
MTVSWYVLHSKPLKEDFLAKQLELRNIETYAPSIKVQVVNPRARKMRPYFPGYIFVHLDFEKTELSSLHYAPGASGLIMFGGEPANVPESLIHAIQQKVNEINLAGGDGRNTLKSGETVMIHDGPFSGYEAIFDHRLPGTERVQVLLKLLKNRQMPLELPVGQVRPKRAR